MRFTMVFLTYRGDSTGGRQVQGESYIITRSRQITLVMSQDELVTQVMLRDELGRLERSPNRCLPEPGFMGCETGPSYPVRNITEVTSRLEEQLAPARMEVIQDSFEISDAVRNDCWILSSCCSERAELRLPICR